MPVDKTAICIVCNTFKVRFQDLTCVRCHHRVAAEGTHDLYGVPKESPTRQAWRVQAQEYNTLVLQGWSQKQIAQEWNMQLSTLRSRVYRWKLAGIKVVPAVSNRKYATVSNKPTSKIRPKLKAHGEGPWGVKDCSCEPCMAVRRVTRAATNRKHRLRLKQERERLGLPKPQRAAVEHGQGKTGKKNCRCDLCWPLKIAYMKEFKRKQREAARA